MKCSECNSENKEGSKFCKVCGNKFTGERMVLDEKEVKEISVQNTRLEMGHLLMIGGAIGYFILFLITQLYQPSYNNLEDVQRAVDTLRILSWLSFFCIIAFMIGSILCIDVLKKR